MGKVRSTKFFAHQQFNLRKREKKEEKKEKQKQQQRQRQSQEELAEAHGEVDRLEENIQVLQQRLGEALDTKDALERGNRENQAENTRLHQEIRRLQTNATRRTKKKDWFLIFN
jgi:chromosome segregation ATPase